MKDIYEHLAVFLDRLPGGYPRTENGVELRILRKLFTPEEAQLFMHLTLLPEEPRVIAHRSKQPLEVVGRRLDEMEKKGLIMGVHQKDGRPTGYLAQQFIVGFWEGQANRLDREMVEYFEEYFQTFSDPELWRKAPQIRTVPVGESIPTQLETMPYELAEKVVGSHSRIAVANCVCRQEHQILGEGCGKPMETCMSFGGAAEYIIASGRGRRITREEGLALLKQADEAGLVLSPANSKNPTYLCACCGDCCGVLRTAKRHPKPASIISSPYMAAHDDAICDGCGTCVDRCQMEAVTVPDGVVVLNLDRCIGCGLCVTTCTTGAMTLVRKPESEQRNIPKDVTASTIQLAKTRGVLSNMDLVAMMVKSKIDRLVARM